MPVMFAPLGARGLRHCLVLVVAGVPAVVGAQTDYFNTDRGRPLLVQDAIAIERYAFELQAAPLTWSRVRGSRGQWTVEPELAYGILRRTQFEMGLPIHLRDGGSGDSRWGVGAVHVSVLHALNTETLGIPALALNVAGIIPAGAFGPHQAYASIGALVTRTTRLGRMHLNADATLGPGATGTADPGEGTDDVSRWMAGVALDRAMPLRSLLVGAELVAQRTIRDRANVEWRAASGIRWQLSPQWAVDGGLGHSFGEREWSLTFGAARSFGLLRLMPRGR